MFKSYKLSQVVWILKSHKDEVTKGVKSNVDSCHLALVAKEEISKGNKSKEMVIVDDFDSDTTNDEFTNKEKARMVSNPWNPLRRIIQSLRAMVMRGMMVPVLVTKEEICILIRTKVKESRIIINMKKKRRRHYSKILGTTITISIERIILQKIMWKKSENIENVKDEAYYV